MNKQAVDNSPQATTRGLPGTVLRTRSSGTRLWYPSHIWIGVVVSLFIHLIFLLLFLKVPQPIREVITEVELVTIEQLQPQTSDAKKKQIVSAPEAPSEEKPPPDTRLLSDRDNTVEKEQINRGDAPDAGAVVGPLSKPQVRSESTEKKEQAQPKQQGAPKVSKDPSGPRIKQLTLDQTTLNQKFSKSETKQEEREEGLIRPDTYEAFSRPAGSGARFIGKRGSADYLPNLPDGDITLLNTKADQFAVFVRRVATQVFSQIRQTGWDHLHSSDIRSIARFSSIRAVLSLKGELLKVEIVGPSGSSRFDQVIEQAVQKGARDPNPPPAAVASDGNIRFIFQARSWSQGAVQRNGAPYERRWLLLATGLE